MDSFRTISMHWNSRFPLKIKTIKILLTVTGVRGSLVISNPVTMGVFPFLRAGRGADTCSCSASTWERPGAPPFWMIWLVFLRFFNLYNKSQPEHQTKRGEMDSFRTISCIRIRDSTLKIKTIKTLLTVTGVRGTGVRGSSRTPVTVNNIFYFWGAQFLLRAKLRTLFLVP
jgi:hypothetical protein